MIVACLTRPDGYPRVVNPDKVADVSPAVPGVDNAAARTVITEESGEKVQVVESVDEVISKLGWAPR